MEKQDIDMSLLYTRTADGQIMVKTATEQDFQDIYDYGVDAFNYLNTEQYKCNAAELQRLFEEK